MTSDLGGKETAQGDVCRVRLSGTANPFLVQEPGPHGEELRPEAGAAGTDIYYFTE